MPFWGLCLIGTSVLFLAPLIYTTNKVLIDNQIEQVSQIVNAQTHQMRQMANAAAGTMKMYGRDYSAKAQEIIGCARSSFLVARKSAPAATATDVSTTPIFTVPTTSTTARKISIPTTPVIPPKRR